MLKNFNCLIGYLLILGGESPLEMVKNFKCLNDLTNGVNQSL